MSDDRRLGEDLHESLRQRAAGFSPQPAAMDQVVRRARGIRRRRRTAAGLAAAAAVAAIAVPTGLTLGAGPEAGTPVTPAHSGSATPSVPHSTKPAPSSPAPPTPSTPSAPSSPSSPATQQTHEALTLAGIARGGSVGIGWLEGSTWHGAQGGTQTLPGGPYFAVTPYRGGFLVVQPRSNADPQGVSTTHLTWLDNSMRPAWSTCGGFRLAVSGDLMTAAYSKLSDCGTTASDTLHAGIANGMADSETLRDVPAGELAEPVGLTDQVLVYNLRDLTAGTQQGAWYTDLAGQQPAKQIPGLAYASGVDTSRQQVAGQSVNDPQTGMVVDPVTGKVIWSKQGYFPGQFSTDGKYVAAAYGGGQGEPAQYAILDAATGRRLTHFDLGAQGMSVVATAWSPDDSLLLVAHQGDREAILRLTPGGQVTRVSDVLPADAAHAVVLATQP
jgi:hypothetical protein